MRNISDTGESRIEFSPSVSISTLPFLLGMALFLVIGVRWLWLFRAGQPLDIDEAGYLSFSFLDYYGLTHNGLAGYRSAIEASSVQAPLTSALAALIYCVTGPNWIFGFGVPLLAGLGIIAASYALGRTLGSRSVATISALLVGSCPIIINYSRSYHFALPATFMATMALVALLRSDRCRHFGWASLFGLCLGLMPLARSMTIAFIPGIVLGAIIYVAIGSSDRRRRLLILGSALLIAAIATASWLFPNRNEVFGYLVNYGYGNHAAVYGPSHSRFGFEDWLYTLQTFEAYFHLPHLVVVCAGALALVYLMGQRVVRDRFGALTSALSSNVLPIVAFIAEAIVALTSTQNKGSAFIAPVIPAAIALAVYACSKLCAHPIYNYFVTTSAAIIALLGTVPSIDLKLSRLWTVDVPVIGRSTVIDGRGTIQLYEAAGGFRSEDPSIPIVKAEGRAWVEISGDTAKKLSQLGGVRTATAFGFRDYLYNTNTVGLEQWVGQGMWTQLIGVDPVVTGDTIAGNVDWLTQGQAAKACLLLTSEGDKAEISPLVNQITMAEAAKQSGFEIIDSWAMPDGRKVTLWRRNSKELRCAEIARG